MNNLVSVAIPAQMRAASAWAGRWRTAILARVPPAHDRAIVQETTQPEYHGLHSYILASLPRQPEIHLPPLIDSTQPHVFRAGTLYGPQYELANSFFQWSNGHLITC